MRGTRWLLLVAIAAIIAGIAATYRAQRRILDGQAPVRPVALPADLRSTADNWHWAETKGGRTTVDITARSFRQVKESSAVELEQVELRLYHKDDSAFDLVKSAQASYSATEHRLYSDGDVEITLGVPKEGESKRRLVSIKSSGVAFDSNTGRAETERASTFTFEHGDGKSTGATYDPASRVLEMKKDVEIHWKAPSPHAKPMKIEAGSLTYQEAKSEIWLRPWGRVSRDNSTVDGENVVIHLNEGAIQKVEASKAHGVDKYPKRNLQYAADELWVDFDDGGEVNKVTGQTNARLVSTGDASETTVTAFRVEMNFQKRDEESVLTNVLSTGKSVVESKPLPIKDRPLPETHILRSETIDMAMRDGGREIEKVVTRTPGTLEFLPNQPAQRHRKLEGSQMTIIYGPLNQIETFQATAARTQTDPTPDERKRNRTVAFTSSRDLIARFEPKSSRLAAMEQTGDFTYDEGERKARAAKATLDSQSNMIRLEAGARVWDTSGSTSGDRIDLDQRSGNFTAEGHVSSSRMPEKKKSSEMLSGDEPLQARAEKMDSANHNHVIHYEGKVVMWQGANRIQADTVDVNRDKHTLIANGNVVTHLWEAEKTAPNNKKKSSPPVLTVVRAPHLVYTEENRLAQYTGGVRLSRPGLDVKSRDLRAWLSEAGSDSSLERAFADGDVEIIQSAPARSRTGTGQHAEYYAGDQKIILRGGEPLLVDSKRGGRTRGEELTYFANDDRLLVNGAPDRPASSVIRRK